MSERVTAPHFFLFNFLKGMDFDLKFFFKEPPRFKEEVKLYIHEFATAFVRRTAQYAKIMTIERLLPRHVLLIMFAVSQDPITRYTDRGLCLQQHKIKSVLRVLQRALLNVNQNIQLDPKYGCLDKKLVKGTAQVLEEEGVRTSTAATVYLATCLAEVCGIMLNCTHMHMHDQKTVSLAVLKEMSMIHQLSSGEICTNVSLMRFIHSITHPPPSISSNHAKSVKRVREESAYCQIEERNVSFADSKTDDEWVPCALIRSDKNRHQVNHKDAHSKAQARPSTPDVCFWDDDGMV